MADDDYEDWSQKKSKVSADWAMAFAVFKIAGALETLAWELHVFNTKDTTEETIDGSEQE